MSHTKGPWLIIGDSVCYDSEYGGPFLSIAEHIKPHNINLIAAAPEMLEDLETLVNVLERGTETPEDLEGILRYSKNLIKKAKGEL